MPNIISLGSINVDRIHHVSADALKNLTSTHRWFPDRGETVIHDVESLSSSLPTPPDMTQYGGKGANQAIAATNAGAQTTLLGAVGSDKEGTDVCEHLNESDVNVDNVQSTAMPTGTADIFIDPEGDNRIIVRPGANKAIDIDYIDTHFERIVASDCLLIQNEIPPDPVTHLLNRLVMSDNSPIVFCDPAPASGADQLLRSDAIDYVTPNETEYAALKSALSEYDGVLIRKAGGDDVIVEIPDCLTLSVPRITPVDVDSDRARIITDADADADAEHEGQSTTKPPESTQLSITPPAVEPVDTTGAGDVLSGYLAARVPLEESLLEAVEKAIIAGSISTQHAGAQKGIPTISTVRKFQSDNRD